MSDIKQRIYQAVEALQEKPTVVSGATPLLGDASVLDSMKLVELCLVLEDMAADMGFEFDWTSSTAMSQSRSMFRTAGSLAEEFERQLDAGR